MNLHFTFNPNVGQKSTSENESHKVFKGLQKLLHEYQFYQQKSSLPQKVTEDMHVTENTEHFDTM